MHTTESARRVDATGAAAPPEGPVCAVVLVCWNNAAYLEPCLRSLDASGMRHRIEIVVVDNGSTDGSQAMVRDRFPHVRIVQNERNVGLARACNQGIQCTTTPYVLLLNNDTLVNGPSLDALIDCMAAAPEAAAVGGTLLNEDGSVQAAYSNFSTLREEFLIATRLGEAWRAGYPSEPAGGERRPVGWLSSACLLLRRAALDEVGLLDEEYFIYGDEADLQYRLARAGWTVYYVPDATTIHFGGRSMDRWRRRRMVYRGKMLFYRKNYGRAREYTLRSMLAALTMGKVALWAAAWPLPPARERAAKELQSNADVLRLCLRLE
jgi:hypothetical protein